MHSSGNAAVPDRVARAEHFFLSSFESWRQAAGIDSMVLVGHSLGGYLASAYAVRYPERVKSLILVSPAGIPHGKEYTRYPTTAEAALDKGKQQGDLLAAAASPNTAVDMAAEAVGGDLDGVDDDVESPGKPPEAKGEAKQWQQNRDTSAFRRNAQKCA